MKNKKSNERFIICSDVKLNTSHDLPWNIISVFLFLFGKFVLFSAVNFNCIINVMHFSIYIYFTDLYKNFIFTHRSLNMNKEKSLITYISESVISATIRTTESILSISCSLLISIVTTTELMQCY